MNVIVVSMYCAHTAAHTCAFQRRSFLPRDRGRRQVAARFRPRSLLISTHMASPLPSALAPGLAPSPTNRPSTPGSTAAAPAYRPALSTRTGGSHLHPATSTKWATSTSRAGSVYNVGSVAATSVHLHQANPEEFERALEEFAERQLPDLERLLVEVLEGMCVRACALPWITADVSAHR